MTRCLPQRVTRAVILAAAAGLCVSLSACSGTHSASSTPAPSPDPVKVTPQGVGAFAAWPGRVFSPYFETWTSGSIPSFSAQSGVKYFNLGFLQAASPGSCTLTWDGSSSQPVSTAVFGAQIGQLKQQGGNVALTFGGQSAGNNGTEIADSCTDVNALAADYESVISTYHVTKLDMDVELNALNDAAGIDRRNQAIAMTQAWASSHGHPLQIQYTLPVQPSGLQPNSLSVLQSAVSHGVHVSVVNVMAFDYYDLPGTVDMGTAAIDAASNVHRQLASLFPHESSTDLWAMQGLTFLPGIDDNPNKTEVTQLSDARRILAYARDHSFGFISIWAIERDNGACPGSVDSNSCSGLSQDSWAFSHLLEPFTS